MTSSQKIRDQAVAQRIRRVYPGPGGALSYWLASGRFAQSSR